MSSFIACRDVSKTFSVPGGWSVAAVDDVSLDIDKCLSVALMGASGSGKSTLLALLGGVERADSGTITVDGEIITAMSANQLADYRAGVGFVFQRFHLIPALSVLDNVLVPLVGRVRGAKVRRDRAMDALTAVGLVERAGSMPYQLSGGQQQRVAIARALVVNPRLVLADEATGNLDSDNATHIMDLLHQLRRDFDTTLVIATHDAGIAGSCDVVLHIADGRVSSPDGCVTTPDGSAADSLAASGPDATGNRDGGVGGQTIVGAPDGKTVDETATE